MNLIRIGIPPRTPFLALHRGEGCWLAWIGIRDMQAPVERWIGRYLQLNDDGTALSVTVNDDFSEDTYRIK